MNKYLLALGISFGLSFANTIPAIAVEPAPVRGNARVEWSRVVNNPFDGQVVYDKHFKNGEFDFITSWSPTEIRATFTRYWQEVVGYRTEWRDRTYYDRKGRQRTKSYPEQVPIYKQHRKDFAIASMLIAIEGNVYEYTGGVVSPELANALANAPTEQNIPVRIVFIDGATEDMEIGKGTVSAWRRLFGAENKTFSEASNLQR
ncbi:MAG TPA: hypothetical protein IGS53_21830 [Leptolyngbyaceae cyanobacterium M33_DOE_097]|uniref:Uncharacterized protein n=1 Tax=Oscillatoriales cyanobacterium SpSt-418 TaxID=2282169 RepID=A0A7C3PTY4_9CYAN|nr:hypothetical protein [Leptolyngbyaceae cyanobacterium M33_DOE_097]